MDDKQLAVGWMSLTLRCYRKNVLRGDEHVQGEISGR